MTDSYEAMKSQKEVILARDNEFLRKRRGELVIERDRARAELTRIYDILAGINDAVEIGDDGYARFGSVNDADRLRALVGELEASRRSQIIGKRVPSTSLPEGALAQKRYDIRKWASKPMRQ